MIFVRSTPVWNGNKTGVTAVWIRRKENLGFDDYLRYYLATPQLNDCDAQEVPFMKNYTSGSRLIVLLFALTNLVIGSAIYAGGSYDYSRSELMGNSGLTIFRGADFGNELGLSISIDGIPITTLSRGEGYRAIVRPGRHTLTVTDTPSPYGKTKFTHRTINLISGQNYSFTALWEVETILLEDGGYQYHGFYR
jgi:hypothetical protein